MRASHKKLFPIKGDMQNLKQTVSPKRKKYRHGGFMTIKKSRRLIKRRWKRRVSDDAAVMLSAFLEYVCSRIFTGASKHSIRMHRRPNQLLGNVDIQAALVKNRWLFTNKLVKGKIPGVSSIVVEQEEEMDVIDEDDDGHENSQ